MATWSRLNVTTFMGWFGALPDEVTRALRYVGPAVLSALTVNLIGCFLIGMIFAVSDRVRILTPDMRMLIITGYLGALTTFSSFSLETVNAARAGLTLQPFLNILINNLGGLALTFVGLWLGSLR